METITKLIINCNIYVETDYVNALVCIFLQKILQEKLS